VKAIDEDRWRLYICTPLTDRAGERVAVQELIRVLRSLGQTELDPQDMVLIGERHPMTSDLLALVRRGGGLKPIRARHVPLGITVEEVYAYPMLARAAHLEVGEDQKRLLEDLYNRQPLSVDDLPYTLEMEHIYRAFVQQTGAPLTIRDVFKVLKNLGRQGRLGGKIRTQAPPDAGTAAPAPSEAGTT
jgi:hypothetical protein